MFECHCGMHHYRLQALGLYAAHIEEQDSVASLMPDKAHSTTLQKFYQHWFTSHMPNAYQVHSCNNAQGVGS